MDENNIPSSLQNANAKGDRSVTGVLGDSKRKHDDVDSNTSNKSLKLSE